MHRREVDGQEIAFGNQGGLFRNAMTWWDHETGSLWSQPTGEAIAGPRTGDQLELLPSTLTTWSAWRADHPDTRALDVVDFRSGFTLDRLAIVVSLGDQTLAHPVPRLREEQLVSNQLGDVPFAISVLEGTDRWAVLSRTLDGGEVVELGLDGDEVFEVGGDRRWDAITGTAVEGSQSLDTLPALTAFPRDYIRFFQDGAFWLPTGTVPVAGCQWDQGTDASNLRGLVECDS